MNVPWTHWLPVICDLRSELRQIWTNLKPQSKVTPPHIDGHTDSSDIADMFRDKYQILFNSVPSDTSHIYDFLNEAVRRDDAGDYDITTGIIDKAISRLKSEKNDGDKGLWSNLVIHFDTRMEIFIELRNI